MSTEGSDSGFNGLEPDGMCAAAKGAAISIHLFPGVKSRVDEACFTSGFDCMLKQLVHRHYARHLTLFVEIVQRSACHANSTCSQTQK